MRTEFFTDETKTFKHKDYVKVMGQNWKPIEEATEEEIKMFHTLMTANKDCAAYIRYHYERGVTKLREQVRLCARHFFPVLNTEPDIDDNGALHFDMHKV